MRVASTSGLVARFHVGEPAPVRSDCGLAPPAARGRARWRGAACGGGRTGRHAARLTAVRGAGLVSPAEGGNFGLAIRERKFWVRDPVTVRDPILRMGLMFGFGLLKIA